MFIPIEFIISLNVGKEVLILRQFLTVTGVSDLQEAKRHAIATL